MVKFVTLKVNVTTTKKFRLTQDEINVRKKKLREKRNEKFTEQAIKELETVSNSFRESGCQYFGSLL